MANQSQADYVAEIDRQIAELKAAMADSEYKNPYYMVGEEVGAGVKENKKNKAATAGTAAASAIATAGIGAILTGAYDTYKKYSAYKKQARGGPMTNKEAMDTVTVPYTDQLPFFDQLSKVSPRHIMAKQLWGTTKDEEQVYRDRVRKDMRKFGFLSPDTPDDYTVKFSDGTVFDFGKDGGAKLLNADGSERKYKDIDFTNPLAQQGLNYTNGLGYLVAAGVPKKDTGADFAGYFTNAVTEGAKDEATIKNRAKELYMKAGYGDIESVNASFDEMAKVGRISEEERDVFKQQASTVGLPSATKPAEEPQEGGDVVDYEIPDEKPMSKKRLNSRFSTGFTPRPSANDVSTGVNQYLAMLETMGRG